MDVMGPGFKEFNCLFRLNKFLMESLTQNSFKVAQIMDDFSDEASSGEDMAFELRQVTL